VSALVLAFATFPSATEASSRSDEAASVSPVVCVSKTGERQTCAADTRSGVTLEKSMGPGACELGRTWGYDEKGVWVSEGCSGEFSVGKKEPKHFGTYTPARGFKVADTEHGNLNIRVFTYVRYLNQSRLDDTYTDAFGQTRSVQQRQDFQVNKAQIYFFGWIMDPKLRYMTYVWTSNTSQGLSAQVVVAGNLQYRINEHLTVGGGITGLPGVRSTQGNFPYWLSVDARQIGDEFFRPSYTTGIWANGRIAEGLDYEVMLGNNLSQLGVDAGQLDDNLNTWSGVLTWMPTTGEYGPTNGFGDFEDHQEPATRIGLHFTRSDENRQGQPNTDAFENVQIRVSDGSVIFAPNLFGPGIQIDDATYHMAAFDAGLKYRGYSLEGEYYQRWINNFRGTGTAGLPFNELNDHGFQLQASTMLQPKTIQLYAGGSKVFGEYGDPWDARAGLNWFPWQNQVVRWNVEYIHLRRSPVGALSLPYVVGANGSVVYANFMVWF
jgi:hypothetical protein